MNHYVALVVAINAIVIVHQTIEMMYLQDDDQQRNSILQVLTSTILIIWGLGLLFRSHGNG